MLPFGKGAVTVTAKAPSWPLFGEQGRP